MMKKPLPFILAACMIFAPLSGAALSVAAEGETGDKVVNLRRKSDGSEISNTQTTTFENALTGVQGYVNGASGADAAYLGEQDGKVKFMISGVVGLVDADKVYVCAAEGASLSYYMIEDGKFRHYISADVEAPEYYPMPLGPVPSCLNEGVTYYSYDGHYFYEDYSVMLKDYIAETRDNSVNAKSPYYNYYQYLPFRTKSVYTGDEITRILNSKTEENSKLRDLGECLVQNQDKYGINALMMASIAVNESAWGLSAIAQNKNNLFGLNAVDSSPGDAYQFGSTAQCVEEFAKEWMSKGYADPGDLRYRGLFLGDKASGINVKYASDPYWGEKVACIAWRLDAENDIDKQDRFTYTIGVKDTKNYGEIVSLNVRKESNTDSPVIYKTGVLPHYAFVISGEENGFYKVQSDPPLLQDRSAIADVEKETGTGEYDFDAMYLFAFKDYITLINGEVPQPVEPPHHFRSGDVNGDGYVDATDMQRIYSHLNGSNPFESEDDEIRADVNGDGFIDATDMQRIYSHLNGSNPLPQ